MTWLLCRRVSTKTVTLFASCSYCRGFNLARTGITCFLADSPDPLLLLVVPAVREVVPEVRQRVREHLQLFGIQAAGAVELAITEAVGNAALHAYPGDEPGEVEVAVNVAEDRVEAVIRDQGVGSLPSPCDQGGGYGVVLMEALADGFDIEATTDDGTTVRMEFLRPLG